MASKNTPEKSFRSMNIGEIVISSKAEEIIWTVLGSCVSIIFHVKDHISIMCHSQLPYCMDAHTKCFHTCPNPCFNDLDDTHDNKYVKCSIEYMIKQLKKNNIDFKKLNTTIIGGASILPKLSTKPTIGEMNVATAKEILNDNQIRINRELVGGLKGYTLWYHTNNDRLLVKIQSDGQEKNELFNNK